MPINFFDMEISDVPDVPPPMTADKIIEVVDLITAMAKREEFLEACRVRGFSVQVPATEIRFIKQLVLDFARENPEQSQNLAPQIQAIVRSYPQCI